MINLIYSISEGLAKLALQFDLEFFNSFDELDEIASFVSKSES